MADQPIKTLKQHIDWFLQPKIGLHYHYQPKSMFIPRRYYKAKKIRHNLLRISIVTPSYNQGPFLEKTIASILSQNYPDLEYIIQDGGSTDESVKIIQHHQASLKHWESKKDQGQSQAINLGFRHATGDIMAYLNSDDLLLPGALNYIAHYFNQHPDIDVVYGHRILINELDQEIGRWILPPHDSEVLTWEDYVPQETLFWRRQIWDKAGGRIDDSFKFAMDWDLLLRFKDAGARFARLPRFLGAFRIHPQQKNSVEMATVGSQEIERLRLRSHGYPVTLQEVKQKTRGYRMQHVICDKLYQIGIFRY